MIHQTPPHAACCAILFAALSSGCDSGTGPSGDIPPTVYRYVAESGTDRGDCLTQTSPCRTIQYALNQGTSSTSDSISVETGSYIGDLTVTLTVRKFVSIRGAGSALTALVGTIRKVGSLGDLTVNGLSMAPNGVQATGIDFTSSPGSRPDLTVLDVIVRGYSVNGILSTNAEVTVRNSQVLDTGADGIRTEVSDDLDSEIATVDIHETTVMRSGDDGIQINGHRGRVTVEKSLIDFNGGAGIQAERLGGTLIIRDNCIRRSQTEAGIFLDSQSAAASMVTVVSNNITGNACGARVNTARADRYSMTNNWWGTPGGPAVSTDCAGTNVVVGPIDYVPVLTATSATTPSCPP